jgi:hypothetical protein
VKQEQEGKKHRDGTHGKEQREPKKKKKKKEERRR